MKRVSTQPIIDAYVVFNDFGDTYVLNDGKKMLFDEKVWDSQRENQVIHYFRGGLCPQIEGEFDNSIMNIEHIPELERSYGCGVMNCCYAMTSTPAWDGSYYKPDIFALIPSYPEAKKYIALLEFEIWMYLEELRKKGKSCHKRVWDRFDPIFYVFNNGVIRVNMNIFMSASEASSCADNVAEYHKFMRPFDWEKIDHLQQICEKYGYFLK